MLPWIFALALLCLVIERLVPGWRLPKIKTWPLRVIAINVVQLGVVVLAGFTWEKWTSSWSLLGLGEKMSPWAGGALAYFVATFVFYWWHRVRHTSDWLWLHFHQIHHSPQRLEVITSFYKHPVEMIVNSIIGSVLVYSILGLSPEAGAIYTFFTAIGEFFYHTNVKTPRWVGYFFQRPEMHRIHHKYGYHKNNYGDIVWWDMLFGTYENPETFDATCGFDPEKEEALGTMLAFKDVHAEGVVPKVATRSVALLAACAVTFASVATPADACTSFRVASPQGAVLMAKNYDWALADGYVVALPKGQARSALMLPPLEGVEPMRWISRYSSLAFTQFGIGFAISGMNDQGLAIETLVNATGEVSRPPYGTGAKEALLSLQWVQYQLDTARSTGEVVKSLTQVELVQLLMPVHFLVCDKSGDCAVVETDDQARAVVSRRAADTREQVVLANRDWSLDAKDAKVGGSWLPSVSLEHSSVDRFAEASEQITSAGAQGLTVDAAFELLEDVRMPWINRWQIVWNLSDGKAYWVNRDGKSSKAERATFSFEHMPSACAGERILAARLGSSAKVASPLKWTERGVVEDRLEGIFDRSMTLLGLRGGELSKDLRAGARAVGRANACR